MGTSAELSPPPPFFFFPHSLRLTFTSGGVILNYECVPKATRIIQDRSSELNLMPRDRGWGKKTVPLKTQWPTQNRTHPTNHVPVLRATNQANVVGPSFGSSRQIIKSHLARNVFFKTDIWNKQEFCSVLDFRIRYRPQLVFRALLGFKHGRLHTCCKEVWR